MTDERKPQKLTQDVTVDYVTSFRYDYLCIFTIRLNGVGTVYVTHINERVFRTLDKQKLPRYLLENIKAASVALSFNEARGN